MVDGGRLRAMPELNDEDRQRWFDACDDLTAAQQAFARENDRYVVRDGKVRARFDHAALERLRELAAAETEAREARDRVGLQLKSKLG